MKDVNSVVTEQRLEIGPQVAFDEIYDMCYNYSFDKKALKQLDDPVQKYIID